MIVMGLILLVQHPTARFYEQINKPSTRAKAMNLVTICQDFMKPCFTLLLCLDSLE